MMVKKVYAMEKAEEKKTQIPRYAKKTSSFSSVKLGGAYSMTDAPPFAGKPSGFASWTRLF